MAEQVVGFRIQVRGTPQQTAEITKLERAVSVLAQRRNNLNSLERRGLITTRDAARARGTLNIQLAAQRNRLRDLNRSVLQNNDALRKNTGFVKGVAGGLTAFATPIGAAVAGFALVSKVVGGAINIFKGFQTANSNLAAVLGKQRSEITALSDDARRLGASTAFTATEVAGLQTEFAKLGFSEQQILSTTEATLNLAAAAKTDLSTAATIAGSTVRAFGLRAADTASVVDIMAKSFSSSSLDISKFQVAIANVGPVAASSGRDLETTTALIGTLTDAGIDASTAGTGLRNVFLELSKRGITLDEALNMIRTATDKNSVALDLFGKRGATIGTVLASNTERTAELEAELRNAAGTAQQMADTQLDNLEGSLTKLSSAWEGLVLSVEDGDGALSSAAQTSTDTVTQIVQLATALNSLDFSRPSESARRFAEALANIFPAAQQVLDVLDQLDETREERATDLAAKFVQLDEDQRNKQIAALERFIEKERALIGELDGDQAFQREQQALAAEELLNQISILTEEELALQKIADEEAAIIDATGKKEAEKRAKEQAKLLLLIQIQLEDNLTANIVDADQRAIALENLRFEREQQAARDKFEGQKQLDDLLLQQEIAHQQNIADLETGTAERRRELEAQRLADIEKRIQEELALEIEAAELKRDLQLLELEESDIRAADRRIQELVILEEFESQKLAIRQQFDREDVDSKRSAGAAKKAILDEAEKQDRERLQRVQQFSNQIAGAVSNFLIVAKNRELEAAGTNAKQREEIEKKFARSQQAIQLVTAGINTAAAVIAGLASPAIPPFPSAIAAGIVGAANIALIAGKTFNRGGMANGPDHANGGIWGIVRGGGGAVNFEGGEAIINKKSSARFRPLLSSINSYNGFGDSFDTGGVTLRKYMAQEGTILPSTVGSAEADAATAIAEETNTNLAEVLNETIQDIDVAVVESVMTDTQKDVRINESLGEF